MPFAMYPSLRKHIVLSAKCRHYRRDVSASSSEGGTASRARQRKGGSISVAISANQRQGVRFGREYSICRETIIERAISDRVRP